MLDIDNQKENTSCSMQKIESKSEEQTSRHKNCSDKVEDQVPHASCTSNRELGKRGEDAAVAFLQKNEYEILERNWTCFAGEVDIIAKTENTLCFIEVKTRTGIQKGFPEESVTPKKRDKYEKIAACYLADSPYVDMRVRFDVIAILVCSEKSALLRFHVNAFGEGSL